MSTQRVLDMNFKGENGKNHKLKVYEARTDVTGEQVAQVMDTVITQDVFNGTAGKLVQKESAKLIVTETTVLDLV